MKVDPRALPGPVAERRLGPLILRLLPAGHPTADLEKALALVGGVALLALAFVPLAELARAAQPCRFLALTGYPCLTCGGTRAVLALARLDVVGALRFNPLLAGGVLLTLALAPLAAAAWVLRWPRPRLSFATSRSRWGAAAMVVLLLAANWTWVIVAGGSGR